MINTIAENKNRLVVNFMSLSFQQGITILFPLLILPYLLRVLGISGFGVYTLIQTGIQYFDLLITFGFGLTATHRIAKAGNDTALQKNIIESVYGIKIMLFAASLAAILICSLFIPYLQHNILIVLASAVYLAGNLLFPDWFFQGIQQMKNCTLVTFISRLLSFILIIAWVKQPGDIDKAFFALATGNVLAGFTGLLLLLRKIKISFRIPGKAFMLEMFKESGYVFISIILVPLYSTINIFILQLFANPFVVGCYSIAQKIFQAASMVTNVVNNTFFPYLSKLYLESVTEYKKRLNSLLLLLGAGFFIAAVIQFFGASFIIELLAGKNKAEDSTYAVTLLKITSFALLFTPFVSFFFQQMILQGQEKQSIKNIVITVIVNLLCATLLGYYSGGEGMAVNTGLITALIAGLNGYSVYKKLRSI
ncbi:oligosaccharide flippase family protein [Ferruginibacter sp.]